MAEEMAQQLPVLAAVTGPEMETLQDSAALLGNLDLRTHLFIYHRVTSRHMSGSSPLQYSKCFSATLDIGATVSAKVPSLKILFYGFGTQ